MITPPDPPIASRGNILIVDDTPQNLRLLSTLLSDRGYEVRSALDGKMALMGIRAEPPDLILLDIKMPQMNGFAVCEQLKADVATRSIPIIFLSALEDVLDKVKAFTVGGVDYITKPFELEEVIARIETHLTIRRLQQQLTAQNLQLQQEICDRQKAEDALQVYLHAVSHDLRNPVTGTLLVLKNWLKSGGEGDRISIARSTLERLAQGCERQLQLINSLLDTQAAELGGIPLHCEPLPLYPLTQRLVEDWELMLAKNQATLEHLIPMDLPPVQIDPNQLWRVFENLIANALKHNPQGVHLTLMAELETPSAGTPRVRCCLSDNGVGITPDLCRHLFERYTRGQNSGKTAGLGLGLYLCRAIIQAHGGEIGVESQQGVGTSFWFTLPTA